LLSLPANRIVMRNIERCRSGASALKEPAMSCEKELGQIARNLFNSGNRWFRGNRHYLKVLQAIIRDEGNCVYCKKPLWKEFGVPSHFARLCTRPARELKYCRSLERPFRAAPEEDVHVLFPEAASPCQWQEEDSFPAVLSVQFQ
jgi:hypothetical protein